MDINSLSPSVKLVNIVTGELDGVIYAGVDIDNDEQRQFTVPLSAKFIAENNLGSMTYLSLLDIPVIGVVSYNNKYIMEDNIPNVHDKNRENADLYCDVVSMNEVLIWGYRIDPMKMIPFDNQIALNRALGKEDYT